MRITGLDTAGADIECSLAISNPNSFGLTLQAYTYDLRIMDLPLAAGGSLEPLEILPGKLTTMRIPIRVKYDDLLQILKLKPDPDHIPYRLQAHLQLTTPFGETSIPLDIKETLKVPEKYRPGQFLKQLFGHLSF